MTKDFILDCEAFELVGEAMFGADWYGLGIKVQAGTLNEIDYDPYREMTLSEWDREQHKDVRDWMNERGFIGEKHERVEFEAELVVLRVAIANGSGAVGPEDIFVRWPNATAPSSDRVQQPDGEQPKPQVGDLAGADAPSSDPVQRSDGEQPKPRIRDLAGAELDEAIRDAVRTAIKKRADQGGKKLNVKEQRQEAMNILHDRGVESKTGSLQKRVEDILNEAEFKKCRGRVGVRVFKK